MNTKQDKQDVSHSILCHALLTVMVMTASPVMAATTINYVYDDLNRVKTVTRSDGPQLRYQYDEVSNLTVFTTRNPDTDKDGLKDIAEINIYHTDPTQPDTDGDGLTDGDEVHKYKTDPTNPDTDGDGLPDGIDPYPLISSDPGTDNGIPFLPPVGMALLALLLAAIGGRKTLTAKRRV